MSEKYTITILLATFNGKSYIDDQIKSIQRQTFKRFKLIILDDASPDGTYEYLVGKYGCFDDISIFRNEVNFGVVKTFEKLLTMVKTEYFCLADQDDVWVEGKLQKSFDCINEAQASLIYSDLKVVDVDLKLIHSSMWSFSNISAISGKDFIPLIVRNSVTGCTVLGHKNVLEKALPFPEGVAMHDRWLALMAMSCNGIVAFNESLVCYRQHGGNQMGSSKFSMLGFLNRIKKFGKGNIREYVQRRDCERCGFIQALLSKKIVSDELVFLNKFYSISRLKRFLNLVNYLVIMFKRRDSIGVQNIFADMVTSILFGKAR